jgi:flagellum-specific ATP synthase
VDLLGRAGPPLRAEIVSVHGEHVQAMAFGPLTGLGAGAIARLRPHHAHARAGLAVDDSWIGRVVDPLGAPLDGRGPLTPGPTPRPVRVAPPDATLRARLGPRIDLGVRALNLFATCRQGQRLGLFAGSGVGKSTLLAMLAKNTSCDVAVIALVGERGREVRDFLEDELGAAGLARAVVVVATSDAAPVMRREAAYAAMTIAEHFRDTGKNVLLLMDSVTRFCLALREIGLSAGEPPATRGYPPSVFAELPRLLERAGPGDARAKHPGQITAIFSVLVEGDDHNEPVADAVRGILDGHVILDRKIAERGRYPAVDVLRSLSRLATGANTAEQNDLARRARALIATYDSVADLIRIGAYRAGADPAIDDAARLAPEIENLLRQTPDTTTTLADDFARLKAVLG